MNTNLHSIGGNHERAILRQCMENGLLVTAVRVRGPGVDFIACDLRHVSHKDLKPFTGYEYTPS